MRAIYRMWKMTHLLGTTEQSRYQDDIREITDKIELVDESQRPGLIALGILEEWVEKKSMTKRILRHSYITRYFLKDRYDFDSKNPKTQEWAQEAWKILDLCLDSDNRYIREDPKNHDVVCLTGKGSSFIDDPVWRMFGLFGPKISVGLIERYWKDSRAIRVIIWSIVIFFTSVVVKYVLGEQVGAFIKFWGF